MKKVWALVLMGLTVLTVAAQKFPSQKEYMETKSVAEKGNIDAQFQMGQYCFFAEKYTETFNWYFNAAKIVNNFPELGLKMSKSMDYINC